MGSETAGTPVEEAAPAGSTKLAVLLSMAMFVLVFDTSLMNVSISYVVDDLDSTASGVQGTIALEALVSAAFILIGSKIGDLIGRRRAYVIGLLGYAAGALAMTVANSLVPVIIFWAVVGGLGASAAIAAAVGPLLGGFITTYLSWRVGFGLELVVIAIVLINIRLVKEIPYTGPRQIDPVGAVLSAVGMGGIVLGILVWQEGGSAVGALLAVGATALGSLVWWLRRRKRAGKAVLLDPGLFKSNGFRLGITGQMLQQIALGGLMIVLPIYLQMVFEYTAMGAGLTIAPLSLGMFATALVASKRAGRRQIGRAHV